MRILPITLTLGGTLCSLWATTLQQLTMDEMIQKSTIIVHARVLGSRAAFRGQDIYTYYQLQILESWKSEAAAQLEVAVPGGAAGGFRQTVAGAPTLSPGSEYVMFVWTSRSGLPQLIGLSQGLFSVMQDATGNAVLIRPAAVGLMLDKSGHAINDRAMAMRLVDLRLQIRQALGAGN